MATGVHTESGGAKSALYDAVIMVREAEEGMTVKAELHRLVDELSEDRAQELLEELRYAAAAVDDEPLTAEDVASIKRGTEDVQAGRVKSLKEYERERGL